MKPSVVLMKLWIVLLLLHLCAASAAEKNLYKDLFTDYVVQVRPRMNFSETVQVDIDLELNQIKDLNEKHEILQLVGFLAAEWRDDYLKWKPENYSGIREIVVPPTSIWLPDFGIQNSADSFYQDNFFKYFRAHVRYNGRINWAFGGLFETSCEIDTTYYPFDVQRCAVIVENWAYNIQGVDLANNTRGIHLKKFHTNGIWNIIQTKVVKEVVSYETNPQYRFPRIKFILYLERKPQYYLVNIMLPCLFLACIAILVFWLPPEGGEKVSLGMTVLLAFAVFQLVIAESTPENSDVTPMLSVFVTLTMGLSTVSILTTIFVLYLHHHSTVYRVPKWLRYLAFKVFARAFCMTSLHINEQQSSPPNNQKIPKHPPPLAENNRPEEANLDDIQCQSNGISQKLVEIKTQLMLMTTSMKDKEEANSISEEWQSLARVLDRLLFWIVLLTLFLAVIWMLAQIHDNIPDGFFNDTEL